MEIFNLTSCPKDNQFALDLPLISGICQKYPSFNDDKISKLSSRRHNYAIICQNAHIRLGRAKIQFALDSAYDAVPSNTIEF